MKQEEQNNSVEDILQSLEGIQRARVNDALFKKIEQNLSVQVRGQIIPLRTVSVAAASILLLLAINILLLTSRAEKPTHTKDPMQQLVHYYGLTDDYGL